MSALLYTVRNAFDGKIRVSKSKEDHFDLIAHLAHSCHPFQVGPPTKRGFQREGCLLPCESIQFHQQQAARRSCCQLGVKRRYSRSDQIGVDEVEYAALHRQELSCERRLPSAIGSCDDDALRLHPALPAHERSGARPLALGTLVLGHHLHGSSDQRRFIKTAFGVQLLLRAMLDPAIRNT